MVYCPYSDKVTFFCSQKCHQIRADKQAQYNSNSHSIMQCIRFADADDLPGVQG